MNTKPMLTAVAAALFSLGACVSAQAADLSTCTTCHSNITHAHPRRRAQGHCLHVLPLGR